MSSPSLLLLALNTTHTKAAHTKVSSLLMKDLTQLLCASLTCEPSETFGN